LAGLRPHIIPQGRFGKGCFRNVASVMNSLPPTEKVKKIVSIDAQCWGSQTAHILAVQESIDSLDFAARGLLDDANRTLSVA
jgi:hypothetical protein